jgi:hypothetical protein
VAIGRAATRTQRVVDKDAKFAADNDRKRNGAMWTSAAIFWLGVAAGLKLWMVIGCTVAAFIGLHQVAGVSFRRDGLMRLPRNRAF